MTYVEDEDDRAKIWSILHDIFHPTRDVTISKALKYIVTLRIANDGNMEAHIRDFTARKRQVEEHSINLMDIIYHTFFMLSMLTAYQMTVTAIESQTGVTLEAAQNRLLEEWWNSKGQSKGDGLLMTAVHPKTNRRKAGNSSANRSLHSLQ